MNLNPATQTKISTMLTATVTIIAVIQTSLTTPPFTAGSVLIASSILAFASLLLTALKQWLSAEVNSMGVTVTLGIVAVTALTGLLNLMNVFHLSDATHNYINWVISVLIAVVNILSKLIFPSIFQKGKIQQLKTVDKNVTR